MARSKLTPERANVIIKALASGGTFRAAAAVAGIGEKTLHRWRAKGERATRGAYHDFYIACEEASAKAILRAGACVQLAIKSGDVKTARWFLERRCPEEYGRASRLDVKADVSASVDVSSSTARQIAEGLSDEALAELADALPHDQAE